MSCCPSLVNQRGDSVRIGQPERRGLAVGEIDLIATAPFIA